MMQAHWECTAARVPQSPVVLRTADTTELDFPSQKIEGAGPLSYEVQRGMCL